MLSFVLLCILTEELLTNNVFKVKTLNIRFDIVPIIISSLTVALVLNIINTFATRDSVGTLQIVKTKYNHTTQK